MPILNYTTNIDPDKTAGEIAKCLSLHGAQAVLTEYDQAEGYLKAISFRIVIDDQSLMFRLPCDWKPVLKVLEQQRVKNRRIEANQTQAVRTAWRIVKDWVEAQMALVETTMVSTAEVFLPYAVMRDGKPLATHVKENPQMLLGKGEQSEDNGSKT